MTDTTDTTTTNTPAPAADAGATGAQPAATTDTTTAAASNEPAPAKTALSALAGDKPTQPSDAKQSDGSDPKDGEDQNKDKDQPTGAPDKYADFALPENMEINAGALEEFQGMAKEANLPQEVAQKFVTTGAKLVQDTVDNVYTAQVEAYAKKVEGWHATRAKDSEIGGTEEAQTAVLSGSYKAVMALGGDSLMAALDETGAGNHPEVIRAFYRIRDLVGEDGKLINGNIGGGEPKTAAQSIYPDLPKQQT